VSNSKREKDEHLERLWYMKEKGQDSLESLETFMEGEFDSNIVDELILDGMVDVGGGNGNIKLTPIGEKCAAKIVRAHRLGERLLYDVFGGEFETGACEFEHIVTEEIIDSICILLGHPRECPHGMRIPEGECCSSSSRTINNLVVPLTELEAGKSAKVAYINYKDERQMHKIDGFQIRPGVTLKLRQRHPCYVIECEGATVAMDEEIVSNIRVWSKESQVEPQKHDVPVTNGKGARGWARLLKFGRGI